MRLTPETFENTVETMTGRVAFPGISGNILRAWRSLYPIDMESKSLNYEYNSQTSRFVVKCPTSPVHESVSIFFNNRVSSGLQARLGDTYQDTVQVSTGFSESPSPACPTLSNSNPSDAAFTAFNSNEYGPDTQKLPAAYLRVIGQDFPAVVCETGWTESMDDLRDIAKLWLLGTYGQTRVVVVVNFLESKSPAGDADLMTDVSERRLCTNGVDHAILPDDHTSQSSEPEGSSSDEGRAAAVDGPSGSPSHLKPDALLEDAPPITEEDALISTASHSTKLRDLADALLDLHHRGPLSQPLLGHANATHHIFRPNASGDNIVETFTATRFPAPPAESPHDFVLTFADLLRPSVAANPPS